MGDALVIVGGDGSRFVVDGYFLMQPPPALAGDGHVLSPDQVQVALASHIISDGLPAIGADMGEQLAAAADPGGRGGAGKGGGKPFASEKSLADFTAAISSGRDLQAALDDLVAAEIRQAVARGVPKGSAQQAAELFVAELAANLSGNMGISAAIAEAERVFLGAIKSYLTAAKPDPLVAALASGKDVDGALAAAGVAGKGAHEAVGHALANGEGHKGALSKGHLAADAHAKAAANNPDAALLNALGSGEGADQFAALADPVAAQRFAELLQQGVPLAEAAAAAQAAAAAASGAQKAAAAAAARHGGLEALASGQGAETLASGTVGSEVALALSQAGVSASAAIAPSGAGGGMMEALASGQGVANGGSAFEQAFGSALAGGASIAAALAAGNRAAQALGAAAGGGSALENLASGNASGLSGSAAFEAALGEALAQGMPPAQAVAEAASRAAATERAVQLASAAAAARGDGGPAAASGSSGGAGTGGSGSSGSGLSSSGSSSSGSSSSGPSEPGGTYVPPPAVSTTPIPAPAPLTTASIPLSVPQSVVPTVTSSTATAASGSRNDPPPQPVNQAPSLTMAQTATLAEDGTLTLAFDASDSDGRVTGVVATSDNAQLLPSGTLVVQNGTLRIAPAPNQYGSATVTVTATDDDGAVVSHTVAVTVTPVNDAPVITGTVATAIDEDVALAANTGISVASLLGNAAADVENDAVGMAVTGFGTTGGSWQYKIAGGTWTDLTGASVTAARLLAPDASLRFVPDTNWNGATTLAFQPWDQTAGGASGGTADLWLNPNQTFGDSYTATMTVNPVNDAPTITSQAATLTRGAAIDLAGKLVAADVDNPAAQRTFTVTAAPSDGALYLGGQRIAAGGAFTQDDIDQHRLTYQHFGGLGVGDDSFTFLLSDGAGGVLSGQSCTLTVAASSAPQNVHVYAPASAQTLTSFVYQDTAGKNVSCNSSGTYTLKYVTVPAASATLTVSAYDVNYILGERDKVFINGHEVGTLTGFANTNSQNSWGISTSWLHDGDNTITVQVSTANIFGVTYAADLRGVKLSFATTALTTASITAFDIVGGTVNGATAYADARAVVAVATTGSYRLEFKLVDPSGRVIGSDAVAFSGSAGDKVVVNGSPAYALSLASGSYKVEAVLVSTSGGSGQTVQAQSFTHTQNTGPSLSDAALMVAKSAGVETVVARLGHSDTDLNQAETYTLLDDAGGRFKLVIPDATKVPELRLAASLASDAATSHVVQVKVTDAAGLSRVESFTIAVSSVNQAPTAINLTASGDEDGTITGAAAYSDLDGDALSYAVAAQGAHGTATINATTGQWSYTPTANWSGTDSFTISGKDPTHAAVSSTVTVEVAAVNDAPTTTDRTITVTEDTATVLTAADFGFADVDAGDTLASVKLMSVSGGGSFQSFDGAAWVSIDAATQPEFTAAHIASGYLRYVPAANDSGVARAGITFQVSDGMAFSATRTLTVDVTAVSDTVALADRLYLKSNANVQLSSFTFEGWVKTTDKDSPFTGIVATLGVSDYGQMCLNTAGQLVLQVQGGGSNRMWAGGSTVADGTWHHVAASYDAGSGAARLYVDGVAETATLGYSAGAANPNPAINAPLVVGIDRVSSSQQALTGSIDEVRVWNDVRTQAEIVANMSRPLAGTESGLVGAWRFEENPATTYAGTVGPALVQQGGSLRLDASDGTVDTLTLTNTAHSLDVGAAGTVSLWVKMDNWATGIGQDPMIVSSGLGGFDPNCLYIDSHDVAGLHFRYGFGADSRALTYATSQTWQAGSWHNIAATWENTGGSTALVLYVDGVAVDTDTTGNTFMVANAAPLWTVGRDPTAGAFTYANGMQIDDLHIWSVARSAAEIANDMNFSSTGTEPGLAGYWKLDDHSGATAADATGHGNSGTLANATWTAAPSDAGTVPQISGSNHALTLDGVDDKAVTATGISLAGQSFSWEFWDYRAASANGDTVLSQGSATTEQGLHVGYGAGNTFVFGFTGDDLTYTDAAGTGVNVWTHWAGSYDAGTNTRVLYKNGAEVARDTASGDYAGSGAFTIGADIGGANAFGGRVDEVRVWNGVRTAGEIHDNAQHVLAGTESGLAGYWRFDETTGTTVADSSVNNLVGVLSGGAAWDDLVYENVPQNQVAQFLLLGQSPAAGASSVALVGSNGGVVLGSASVDTHGVVTYTGTSAGEDNISYQVTDAMGQTSSGVLHLTVA
jgi:VCBS repeat-containing protein